MNDIQYYNFSMNFCQKHQNHHCIHAHECKNPQHQKHIQKKSLQQHNKTIAHIQQSKKSSENCTFTKSISHKSNKEVNNQLLKLLHDKQIKVCELEHASLAAKQKYDKIMQENKHLYTQIEYYRQQFASLIQNSQQDNKNQIKKRVKETTNLILKIASLENENQTLISQNQKLKDLIEAERSQKCQSKHIYKSMQQKYDDIHSKLRVMDKQKEQFRQQAQGKGKQYQRLRENYEILKKQFNNDCQKSKKTIRQLTQQLQLIKKQLSKLKNSSEKQKQLLLLEISNHEKREEALKDKITSFQTNNKEMFTTIKDLKQKNEELEENLYHAKKIIDRNQENAHQYTVLQKELNEKNVQTNTIIREHYQTFSAGKENKENKQTVKDNDDTLILHQEIKALKQKIAELEKRNMTNYEQIILNMGASQAFKKLVEEKNAIIKKLMREKGEIYAKAVLHQH